MVEFDAKINQEDMYSFNLRHTYTSSQGILSIVIAAFLFAASVLTRGRVEITYTILYICLGVLFLVFLPFDLKLKSKRQILTSEVLQNPLHYKLCDEGVVVTSPVSDEVATLPWDCVYKIVTTKKYLLIHSSRVNAYIIPKSCIESVYPKVKAIIEKNVKDYKLTLKW